MFLSIAKYRVNAVSCRREVQDVGNGVVDGEEPRQRRINRSVLCEVKRSRDRKRRVAHKVAREKCADVVGVWLVAGRRRLRKIFKSHRTADEENGSR